MSIDGAYVHVPFCARRCGYCDFNTYVMGRAGLTPDGWLDGMRAEIALARRAVDDPADALRGQFLPFGTSGTGPAATETDPAASGTPLRTVFFGGGTPTLLGAGPLVAVLDELRATFGLVRDAEVTVEANPETVTDELLDALLAGGVTRLSLGMQSADAAVLRVLDRVHTPGQATRCVEAAHKAGFRDVSLDLIYGTPGESLASWQATLEAALSVAPEHVSCYALIVEPGTPLARRIEAGELPAPDDDLSADKYDRADELLTAAGLTWYELSNWALDTHECRHNLGYWRGLDWWGFGPGAHSHRRRRRWWNHKSPARWAAALAAGRAPEAGSEIIDDEMAHQERVLLELRLASGLPRDVLTPEEASRVPALVDDGLLFDGANRLVLTRRGRLLADLVTRQLLG